MNYLFGFVNDSSFINDFMKEQLNNRINLFKILPLNASNLFVQLITSQIIIYNDRVTINNNHSWLAKKELNQRH